MTINDGQLRWKCRRGMLELDVLFERFLATNAYKKMTEPEYVLFDQLLEKPDPVILNWLMGHEEPELAFVNLVKKINQNS